MRKVEKLVSILKEAREMVVDEIEKEWESEEYLFLRIGKILKPIERRIGRPIESSWSGPIKEPSLSFEHNVCFFSFPWSGWLTGLLIAECVEERNGYKTVRRLYFTNKCGWVFMSVEEKNKLDYNYYGRQIPSKYKNILRNLCFFYHSEAWKEKFKNDLIKFIDREIENQEAYIRAIKMVVHDLFRRA